jgi:hypothetical protein
VTETGKFIHNNDFCEITTDKILHENMKQGAIVFVVGHKALPISEDDPYTQRIKFFCHLFDNHTYTMSKELYPLDPSSLRKLDQSDQENFTKEFKLANGIN